MQVVRQVAQRARGTTLAAVAAAREAQVAAQVSRHMAESPMLVGARIESRAPAPTNALRRRQPDPST